jgi:predicted ATPase
VQVEKLPLPHESSAGIGSNPCGCSVAHHETRFIVVTGGPGAGKTAMLELAKRRFCRHVRVLPEAATMLFGAGFPRGADAEVRRAAQSAIFHVESALERAVAVENVAVVLCDRGTLDGLAYWPGDEASFLEELGTTLAREYARYATVIHLRTPPRGSYNHDNPVRVESAESALELDKRIEAVWAGHSDVHIVSSEDDFLEKTRRALTLVESHLPACCRGSVEPLG